MLSVSFDLFQHALSIKLRMRSPIYRWLVITAFCLQLIACVGGDGSAATLVSAGSGKHSIPTAIEIHHLEKAIRPKLAFDSGGDAFVVWELMEGYHFDSYAILFR